MDIVKDRVDLLGDDGKRNVKSFVLRKGKLRPFQEEAIQLYSEEYVIPFSSRMLDFSSLFSNDHPTVIEIGFGMGTSTKRIVREQPETNFIGIEVFLSGFTKLLSAAGREKLKNLRLIRFDAVQVLTDMIPDGSVAGFHIFFPDPWPKKRHHKRRLIQKEFATLLSRKLISGGYIYCVTDWIEYAHQMVEVFDSVSTLVNPSGGFCQPVSWRPSTGFERKGKEKQHPISEIWVEKL